MLEEENTPIERYDRTNVSIFIVCLCNLNPYIFGRSLPPMVVVYNRHKNKNS